MERMSVTEAGRHFDELIDRVTAEGVIVELERDKKIVARVSPVGRWVKIDDLNRIFGAFPSLGDDVETFANDLERVESDLPPESNPWA